jgi:DNA-binding GntR family transcriptional regulator
VPGTVLKGFDPGVARRRALWEIIADAMRRAIVLGDLPASLRLDEPALARKFGVSRVPVREALVRLEHEGLVRLEPHRGAFIIGLTEQDVRDLYELRQLIERRAVRRAAGRIGPDGVACLRRLAERMDRALRAGQPQAMVEPDVSFHRLLVAEAGSGQLLTAWERLAGLIGAMLEVTDLTYRGTPSPVHGHERIIETLARRDGAAAEEEIRAHLENGEHVMREAMRALRAGGAAAG